LVENKLLRLVVSLSVCLLAGYISSLYAIPLLPSWFASLNKPGFIPPDTYFVPIGLVVYILLGFTLNFIWQADKGNYRDKRFCLFLFILGLIFNVLWVYVFFGLRSPLIGLLISIMLYAILISTIYQALRVSFPASLLLVPNLIITFIIGYANYMILIMNPHLPPLVIP